MVLQDRLGCKKIQVFVLGSRIGFHDADHRFLFKSGTTVEQITDSVLYVVAPHQVANIGFFSIIPRVSNSGLT